MANNIQVKDGLGALQTIATNNPAGVHTPEHIITAVPLDPFGVQADAAVVGDTAGSISAKLRGILKVFGLSLPATLGQKVMASSLPVCFASDQTGLSIGALGDSELHIGQVTKPFAVTSPTLTVTASSAYTQGFCVGGILTFTNAARVALGSGKVISILLLDADQQNASYNLLLFDTTPSHSTFTNGAVALLDPLDFPFLLGAIDITSYISIGTSVSPVAARAFARVSSDIPFVLPSGTSLFGVLLLKNDSVPPTYNSSTSLKLRMWIDQN
jgi:hypothetical protein